MNSPASESTARPRATAASGKVARTPAADFATATIACIVTTAIAAPLSRDLDLANVVMLYPLAVLLVAFRLGRAPAILAAFLNVALFDFFLVPPYYTFAVADIQYLLTFAVMLAVALVTGHLTADLRQQAEAAAARERRTHALYEMARELGRATTLAQVGATVRAFADDVTGTVAVLLLYDEHGELRTLMAPDQGLTIDREMARIAGSDVGFTDIDAAHPVRYQPMKTAERVHGVLAFLAPRGETGRLAEHAELFEAIASLAAISLDRVRYVETASREQGEPLAARLRGLVAQQLASEVATALAAVDGALESAENAALEAPRNPVSGELRAAADRLRAAAERLRAGS